MAIHPIDLQTLYAQMEKVGRQQGAEQQSLANSQDAKKKNNKLDAEKRLSTVQLVEQGGQESMKINEDSHNAEEHEIKKKKEEPEVEESTEDESDENYIKDPYIGQKVDISG